jgi:hypothetical protein
VSARSERERAPQEHEGVDVVTVTRDDTLLDALGQGDAGPEGDSVAMMLAAWRGDLATDLPTVRRVAVAPPVVARPAVVAGRRSPRLSRTLAGVAAAVVVVAGSVTVGAANAGPDSPLWPITRIVFEERADSLLAQHDAQRAIERARNAIGEARYTDAERLLDEATRLIGLINDQAVAQRLRAEVAAVRAMIPGAGARPTRGVPTTAPASGAGPTPSSGGGAHPTHTPGPSASQGGGLPLPSPPVPTATCVTVVCVTLPAMPPVIG